MPLKPRSIKVPDDLWDEAHEAAKSQDETISIVVRRALREYVARIKAAA